MAYLGNQPTLIPLTTGQLEDLLVTTDKLANNAVTNLKMADEAVGTAELVNFSVTSDKIANSSITSLKLDTNITITELTIDGTGAMKIASGNTAQRDISKGAGSIRFNTETSGFEGWSGSAWGSLGGGGGGGGTLPILDRTANVISVLLDAGTAVTIYGRIANTNIAIA